MHGAPPQRIDATHVKDGVVTKSRPLCPYGTVARWDGAPDGSPGVDKQ
jgi:hypothetical protein